MKPMPRVTIIIVSRNGREHLGPCLDSLGQLDYPPDLIEILVVDNASEDGTEAFIQKQYPAVRVIRLERNLGFAEPNNIAAAEAKGEYLAFLNNDMTVDRSWLGEMVKLATDPDGADCVGGRVLSWDGREVDFSGGVVNFEGRGFQVGYKAGSGETAEDGGEIFFPNGGSLLIRKEVFLDVGGFDPDYFAYYEDVDLGWRLWLYGHRVVFSRGAVTYHRHGGTTRGIPEFKKRFLRQRNALFTLMKNYGEGSLSPALGASLLLLAKRAMAAGKIRRSDFSLPKEKRGLEFDAGADPFGRDGAAELAALQAASDAFPRILKKRKEVQGRRKTPEADILRRFGDPFRPIVGGKRYASVQKMIVGLLGLRRMFVDEKKPRILFVTRSIFGKRMSGPDVRFLEIARALCSDYRVVITTPYAFEQVPDDLEIVRVEKPKDLASEVKGAKVIFTSGFALESYPVLREGTVPVVVDLYCPFVLENLEFHKGDPGGRIQQRAAHSRDLAVLIRQLEMGDYFLCASEREADFVLGALLAAGRINPDTYTKDPMLRRLVGVVPFGVPKDPPVRRRRAIREAWPRISAKDKVLIWGGGIQPWMDPETLIRAMAIARKKRDDLKLVFLGARHPSPEVPETTCLDACVRLSRELGLHGEGVFFHEWVPYADRQDFLLDADIGVSAHPATLEARFSFRTRYLDYLWAGLPIVTAGEDPLARRAESAGAAVIPPAGDPSALAETILDLVDSSERMEAMTKASRALAGEFTWEKVIAPLASFLENPRFASDKEVPLPSKRKLRTPPDRLLEEIRGLLRQKAAEKHGLRNRVALLEKELRLAEPLIDRVMGSLPFRLYQFVVTKGKSRKGNSTVPIKGDRVVEQAFRAEKENLCGVALKMASYARRNTAEVIYRLKMGEQEIARGAVNASQFRDNEEFAFRFDPIRDSNGVVFTFSLESPGSYLGDYAGCYLRRRWWNGIFGRAKLEHRPIYL